MRQRSQGRAQAQTAQDVTKAMIKKAKRRTCRSFGVSGAVRAPSPAIPPWPTLTILRPFQWLSVEHHVGQGHLGLCRGLCGGEAEGQSRGGAAAAPSVQSQTNSQGPAPGQGPGLDLFSPAHSYEKCLLEAADGMSNPQPPGCARVGLPSVPSSAWAHPWGSPHRSILRAPCDCFGWPLLTPQHQQAGVQELDVASLELA